MGNVVDLLIAIGSNVVSLLSGIFGLAATVCGLLFKGTPHSKWLMIFGVAALILSPSLAWIEEHELRMEMQKDRPYVLIEEVPAETIRAYSSQNQAPGTQEIPEAVYRPGYAMGKAPNGEILMYNVANTGEIAARGLQYFCRIQTIDAIGLVTEIRLPDPPSEGSQVLLPKRSVRRNVLVPDGTFYSEGKGRRDVRVTLAVTFSGQPSDRNLYFYRTVLKVEQFAGSPETVMMRMGSVAIESSDEGVVTNRDDLLK
jgi:hypothetical protein